MCQQIVVSAGGRRIHTELFQKVISQKLLHPKKRKQVCSNEKKRLVKWIKQASEKAIEKKKEINPEPF
jgi:hypothetical protein